MSRNVLLDYIDNYDIKNIQHSLEKAFFSLDVLKLFKPKMKVLIKVCLPYSVSPDCAETTHPSIVRGIVNVLADLGVKCVVADSPYKKYNDIALNQTYLNTGMLEVANLTKCELNQNLKMCEKSVPHGVMAKKLTMLDVVNDVDAIINVGKIKIDENLGYLGACANLFGLVPGEKKTLELNRLSTIADFNNYVLDMYSVLENKTILNVVDGIVSLEAGKTQRMLYCLGVSQNAFSLDASILDILGVKYSNSILEQAENRGMFDSTKPYKQVGCKIEDFKLEDFALTEFNNQSTIHKSEKERKAFYKNNQKRPSIKCKECKGCSICSRVCPTKAISMRYDNNGELYAEIDYNKCILCNKCNTACPYSVVKDIVPTNYKILEKEITKYN